MSLALVRRALVAGGLSGYERPYPPYPAYPPTGAADRRTIILPPMAVAINGVGYSIEEETEIDVANDSSWDRTAIATVWAAAHTYEAGAQIRPTVANNYVYECTTPGVSGESAPIWGTTPGGTTSDGEAVWTCYQDKTIAANRAGQNFNIHACAPLSGKIPTFILSVSSNAPVGFTSATSRKIGQFHCECAAVGTISGHALTGYLAGDILPRSIQDLKHRPKAGFINGMVWGGPTEFDTINYAPVWKAIYMASGTGASVASVFGAAAQTTRDWNAFVSDFGLIGCRMMRDYEFQVLATGIEEEVNITGSANPTTTGGHISTTSRRMVSNIGSEDDAGVWWQWLDEQSYRFDPDGSVSAATKTIIATHVASPGGNPIYAKFLANGEPYLCCNMATSAVDKWLTFGTDYKILIKHDPTANTGSSQVYLDEDATQLGRILVNMARVKNAYVQSNNPSFALQLTHNVNAATVGVALNFDDGADQRLEFTSPTAANGTIDLSLLGGAAWAYYNLAGTVGSLYRQGAYGDAKLLGGGPWAAATTPGSRARDAYSYRWSAYSYIGGRFVAEPQ